MMHFPPGLLRCLIAQAISFGAYAGLCGATPFRLGKLGISHVDIIFITCKTFSVHKTICKKKKN